VCTAVCAGRSRVVVVALVALVVAGVGGGCDARATFARSSWFADVRPALVAECCACLARRGTADAEATCAEAVLVDGQPAVPAGAVFGSGDDVAAREADDIVDPDEIPCLCGDVDEAGCVATLGADDGRLVVPGACLDRLDREAACEQACGGVLSFVPIAAPPS
jgi:hypothetical protein